MNRTDVYKRDNLIVDIISKHIGHENGIHGSEIHKILSENGYSIKRNIIRNVIERIRRERHLPIWYKKGCGYFWLGKAEEVKEAISMLQGTVCTLQRTIDLLQRFVID